MRSLNRSGQWPRSALLATGLGLGALGGFLGSLARDRRGSQAVPKAVSPPGGHERVPMQRSAVSAEKGLRSVDAPKGMRS